MPQDDMGENQDHRDFFIIYTERDRQWAEWIAWQLEEAGHTLFIQAWDVRPGSNSVSKIDEAATNARRTLLVLSAAYLSDKDAIKWTTTQNLLPIRIEQCEAKGLLRPIVPIDLVDLDEECAREQLLAGVQPGRAKPTTVSFPGSPRQSTPLSHPTFPGPVLQNQERNSISTSDTKHLTLFLACPDDVTAEKGTVYRVVEKLNTDSSITMQAKITIVAWDDPNKYISIITSDTSQNTSSRKEMLPPSECDIVVATFWSRLGNPLLVDVVKKDGTKYESEIEWEYEDAINGTKHNSGRPILLLYRNRSDQTIIRHNEKNLREKIAQFRKVVHFLSNLWHRNGSLKGGAYSNLEHFEVLLERNLRAAIRQLVTEVPSMQSNQPEPGTPSEISENTATEELIKSYLNWMVKQHGRLELYRLDRESRLPTIPLEKVYVALKGSQASTYEREQAEELLHAEVSDILAEDGVELSAISLEQLLLLAEQQAIIRNPYMPSLVERDRPVDSSNTVDDKTVTLGEAFRKERWMVILGDPGSGKTTLARWIALKLADAWLRGESSVVVPAYQVDPEVDKSDDGKINMGPTRLPILLRVSEFLEAYQEHKTSSIADFLGKHSWLGQSPPDLSKENLNTVIKDYLRQGRVVVILDGMDEITKTHQRDDVIRSIESFTEDWINARGKVLSEQELSFSWNPVVQGKPWEQGGNQIIITSRIAGYHARPIRGYVTHVTIQAMEKIAVEHFCDAWMLATLQKNARTEASGLKAAIFDPQRPRIRELASNPLLVTILALVYRKNQGHLPEQRVELYQRAMEILIEAWRTTGITTIELIYVLSPLAAHIHQKYSTGLINEKEMVGIIKAALAEFRELDPLNLPPRFVLEVDNFIRCVREDVGLLAERSKDLYGFLHLTFQEYLAALYLVRDKRNAPQATVNKLGDPRWREPILMALGHISMNPHWTEDDLRRLLTALLDADDPLDDLIPRSALLIVSAIPEMIRIPEDVVSEIIRRLLATYADKDGIGQFPTLREKICASFKVIYSSKNKFLLEDYLAKTLLAIENGDRNLALASASLLAENKWQSASFTKALFKAFPYDDPTWDYPITSALHTIVLLTTDVSDILVKPEMGKKDRQELKRLQNIVDELKIGNHEEKLRKRFNDLEALSKQSPEIAHLLKKPLEVLSHEIKKLQSGELLITAEADISRIEAKYHEQLIEYNRKIGAYDEHFSKRQSSLLPIVSETLQFRTHLEKNSRLITYIEENLPWLRLVVLLYGGISDHELAPYIMQDDEITTVFKLSKASQMPYIAELRERAYWQKSWDENDVVSNLAIHLDTQNGRLLDAAFHYTPRFTPLAILNDSPLTEMLLKALEDKKHPSTLKERLWLEWYTGSQEVSRAHALLALLMIDTQAAIDTLIQSLSDTTTFALAEMVMNQLQVRKRSLVNALILLGKKEEIGPSLLPLRSSLTDAQWGDMVELFFHTFSSVMALPVKYDDVLLAYSTILPRVNAEIWAYWLSGLAEDDPFYSFAVLLDTLGKYLASASALINIQHAHNSKYKKLTDWYQLLIPPEYDNYADIVGEALTIASQSTSRSEIIKSLFYAGTMTFAWINYPDYPGLKEDVLAATLLIPFEFQKDIIKDIDTELSDLIPSEFQEDTIKDITELSEIPTYEASIIERVVAIADPVIRARALWRIAHYHRDWKNLALWNRAVEAAEQLDEPLHQSRAFERLLNSAFQSIHSVSPQQREQLQIKALDSARKISDPNNRARALARLALYEGNEKRWSLLSDALTTIRQMTNEQQQIDTLQLLHPYLVENYQLSRTYDDIVKNIKSDWYRHKGENLVSIHLLALHDQLHEPQKLTPIVLAALIDDLADLKPQKAKNEDLWRQLLDPAKREGAISALLKAAAANGLDGLDLTSNVFNVIRSLLDTKEISAIYTLLPYLRGAESPLLPSLEIWVKNLRDKDKVVWAYAGLLLAEKGQVNSDTIPCLIELIENGVDFGRYRASLRLHGSAVFIQKKKRDFSTSQLGEQPLLLLAQARKRLLTERAFAAESIGSTWDNITHNDHLLLQKLIHDSDEGNEESVSSLLRNISYCDSNCLSTFVNHFAEGSAKTQELLLYSWLNLSDYHLKEKITPVQKKRMEEAISKLPDSLLKNFRYIPDRLRTISTALCSLGQRIEEKKIMLSDAPSALDKELSSLSSKPPDVSIEELSKHIGYLLLDGPKNALDAAQTVSENGTALELLFMWLAACLRENIDDVPFYYYRTSTLLELAAATTHFSPAAVYNLCEKNELGPLLVKATMSHSSFWGRAGAATLLGYLRQTPEFFHKALLSGLQDVAEVQTAIVRMVPNLRYLDERMIPKMIDLLAHEDASVVYVISKLLANIAQNERTPFQERQEIIRALSHAILQRNSFRPVFVLNREEVNIFITAVGRLDQQLHNAILDIIGIA